MTTTPTSTTPAATAAPTDLLKAKETSATGLLQGQNSRQTRMDAGFDPATSAPDLLSAAQCVLNNIEPKHRPPKRDMYGTMAYVRVDVLAQLADAVAAAPATAIAHHKRMVELASEVADARAQHKRDRLDLEEERQRNNKLNNKLFATQQAKYAVEDRLLARVGLGQAPKTVDVAVELASALAQTRAVFAGARNAADVLEYLTQLLAAAGVELPAPPVRDALQAERAELAAAETRAGALVDKLKDMVNETNAKAAAGDMHGMPAAAPVPRTVVGELVIKIDTADLERAAALADQFNKALAAVGKTLVDAFSAKVLP